MQWSPGFTIPTPNPDDSESQDGGGESGGGGGVATLTPWTTDIDADGFDLNDLGSILFRTAFGGGALLEGTDSGDPGLVLSAADEGNVVARLLRVDPGEQVSSDIGALDGYSYMSTTWLGDSAATAFMETFETAAGVGGTAVTFGEHSRSASLTADEDVSRLTLERGAPAPGPWRAIQTLDDDGWRQTWELLADLDMRLEATTETMWNASPGIQFVGTPGADDVEFLFFHGDETFAGAYGGFSAAFYLDSDEAFGNLFTAEGGSVMMYCYDSAAEIDLYPPSDEIGYLKVARNNARAELVNTDGAPVSIENLATRSPDTTVWRIKVANDGTMSTEAVA